MINVRRREREPGIDIHMKQGRERKIQEIGKIVLIIAGTL